MKKIFALTLAVIMLFALVACGPKTPEPTEPTTSDSESSTDSDAPPATTENAKLTEFKSKAYKIAYVYNGTPTDIFQMAFDGAITTGKELGMTVDIFTTDADDIKFQDTVKNLANQNYDGMFLSHGKQEYSYDLVKELVDKGIKVVTFDTQLVDASGNPAEIEGVTTMFQNDQMMADQLLDYVCNTLYAEKVKAGEKVNILKIWRGPGISPFDRRQETYLKYEEEGLINTLETIGPIDTTNAEASMTAVMASTLTKYKEGEVDAIWGCFDAYTRGAYVALMDADRTDIPVVTVDISNQDINFMLEGINGEKVWKACSAVHFATVGEQGARLLINKLANEDTPATYNLTPSLVLHDQLNADSTVLNLGDTVPGYGINNDNIPVWAEDVLRK